VSGAGCPRVTHPFAALPLEGLPLPRFPLDLHVLGTPPAFVLSQDQTLRRRTWIRPNEAGFGFDCESRPHRVAHPDRPPVIRCFRTTVSVPGTAEPRPSLNGGNALAFGTLFSSQGARTNPRSRTPMGADLLWYDWSIERVNRRSDDDAPGIPCSAVHSTVPMPVPMPSPGSSRPGAVRRARTRGRIAACPPARRCSSGLPRPLQARPPSAHSPSPALHRVGRHPGRSGAGPPTWRRPTRAR
jgi:hypothetical protein